MTPQTYTLAGRSLQLIVNGPVKHDHFMFTQMAEAGLSQLNPAAGEDVQAYVDRVLDRMIVTGAALKLLGGLLAPAGLDLRKWTPEVAADMTTFLGELMTPEDKTLVRQLTAQAIVGFFQNGIASLATSPTASTPSSPAESANGDPMSGS